MLVVWLIPLSAARAAGSPPVNIARSCPYTLDPRPNYAYCTDIADATQLTDGQYTAGHFWTQKSTVGWQGTRPIKIVIDLGAIRPIRGVSFNTAAGVAGVTWPSAIELFISDDGRQFASAGELVDLSADHDAPPDHGYAVHRFWTDQLHTHGRYLQLLVTAEPFVFVDEIEVYAGDPAWIGDPAPGPIIHNLPTFLSNRAIARSIRRRIIADARAVRALAGQRSAERSVDPAIHAQIDAIVAAAHNLPQSVDVNPLTWRAVLPLNDLHQRVFGAQAAVWRAAGLPPITLWTTPTWDPLDAVHLPPDPRSGPANAIADVQVAMMSGEYRAASINISNASDSDMNLLLHLTGLPGGTDPSYISVHEVQWTDTRFGQSVAAALPLASHGPDGYVIHVNSGLTRQVWFTFHPGADVPPGTYQGRITVSSAMPARPPAPPALPASVSVTLRLFPLHFPDRPTLHLGGWDYTNAAAFDVTTANAPVVASFLQSYGVDSPWATAGALPHGRYDATGKLVTSPSTVNFDRWLQRWPAARQYCVFVNVQPTFEQFTPTTPQFAAAVWAWTRFWADQMQRRGRDPGQLLLLLVDEPSTPQQDQRILAYADAIHSAGTGIRIWEDPIHRDPGQAIAAAMSACDVLCPNRATFLASAAYRDYFIAWHGLRIAGKELNFYSCLGPARLLDPYAYDRLQAWSCWKYGATGEQFWSFGDTGGGSSWNEYAAQRTAYLPFFLDGTSITTGKHMEAIREGLEDYEYLVMLWNAVQDAASTDPARAQVSPALLDRARQLLATAAERVCDAPGADQLRWSAPKDRTIADQIRLDILQTLSALATPAR